MSAQKAEIPWKFWAELGLHVDRPKSNGSGSTNDGNTARRTCLNTDTFASIVGFDREILKVLPYNSYKYNISYNFEINVDKFKNFCLKTASLYMEKYHWHPMSATVHKVLVRVAQIIAAF